jgi:hypothetical protein
MQPVMMSSLSLMKGKKPPFVYGRMVYGGFRTLMVFEGIGSL